MQVAITAAGFTPAQADQLRRAMGSKRSREQMTAIGEALIAGMARHGIPEEVGRRIHNQIQAFADYGFPESHAASFALIVYATAWLRHYYPAEYLAAILNAQPMGFYAPGTLVADAQRHGVVVRPVDLSCSAWDHALELADGRVLVPHDGTVRWRRGGGAPGAPPVAVRLGVRLVKGVGAAARRALEAALAEGPFVGVEDAVRRVALDRRAWQALAEAGALDAWFAHEPAARRRRAAWWAVLGALREARPLAPAAAPAAPPAAVPAQIDLRRALESEYRCT